MGVVRPLRVVLENYPEGAEDAFDAPWHPGDVSHADQGSRKLPFSRVVFIDREDFAEVPPKGWFRLTPGGEVRLRHACIIKCEKVVKDERGEIVELRCTWDPDSRGGNPKDGRKVKGTLHWVSEKHGVAAEMRLYDRLFTVERPGEDETRDFLEELNPASCDTVTGHVEPALADAKAGDRWQLERVGYFCVDRDSKPGAPVLNRTIGLKDSFAPKKA
jgi:glutaminyl-tRNA synthetase